MKKKKNFVCLECNFEVAKWVGKCPSCHQWNTFEEELNLKNTSKLLSKEFNIRKVSDINLEECSRLKTEILEFDRVLGGGITYGSLSLVGGQPGIGKSTLLLEVASSLSRAGKKVLYVSGEESESQVATRARRLKIDSSNLYIVNDHIWQNIKAASDRLKPDLLILDSIQTLMSNEVAAIAGTPTQIKECTHEIMNYSKSKGVTTFIVGHVTKEGSIAGPKMLEHMVDTVIYFEGDQFGHYRILRSMKNRFGSTHEVGVFEMNEFGLKQVLNPSSYFIEENYNESYGRSLTCIMEGSRALFVEVQALVAGNNSGNGRRTTQGFDQNRLSMLCAIIEKYLEIPLTFNDIYINVVGGIKLSNRDSDLSIIASILSSHYAKSIGHGTLFLGEIGLSGEIRAIPYIDKRLREISQMNYKRVVMSEKSLKKISCEFKNLEIIGINNTQELQSILC